MTNMTPEQRAKHVKTIEKIENLARPQKWREIKKLLLDLHPELVPYDDDFAQACKELRQRSASKTAASKSGDLRNTMKIPNYLYQGIIKLDPDFMIEMSGRNHGHQILIGQQLYKAFPEYRIARAI
jgi:hypothetical protein